MRTAMKMKNMIALLTVLALLLCGAASAEEEPAVKTGIYTIINKTGEIVTEVKITDNITGESVVFPAEGTELLAGPFEDDGIVILYFDIPKDEDGEKRLTLSYRTESGREESYTTLSIETVNIELLSADAMTGATPIGLKEPKPEKTAEYTFYNLTGEVVTALSLTDNEDGMSIRTFFDDGFDPGESFILSYVIPAERENTTLTLQFETASGKVGTYTAVKIEDTSISLLDIGTSDSPVSFTAPD